MERILKKYAVFISSKNDVYAVLPLSDSFEKFVHKGELPLYIKTVLLPFNGKIVYDGLFERYSISFGGGIKNDLKELYLIAKQNGKIIETFDFNKKIELKSKPKPKDKIKDFKPDFNRLIEISNKLHGGSGQPPINSSVFGLVKASIELGQQAVSDPDDMEYLWKSVNKVFRSLKKVEKILIRTKY